MTRDRDCIRYRKLLRKTRVRNLGKPERFNETDPPHPVAFPGSGHLHLCLSGEAKTENELYSLLYDARGSRSSHRKSHLRSEPLWHWVPSTAFLLCDTHLRCVSCLSQITARLDWPPDPHGSGLRGLLLDDRLSEVKRIRRAPAFQRASISSNQDQARDEGVPTPAIRFLGTDPLASPTALMFLATSSQPNLWSGTISSALSNSLERTFS